MGDVIPLFGPRDRDGNRLPHGEPRIPGEEIEESYTQEERRLLGLAHEGVKKAITHVAADTSDITFAKPVLDGIDEGWTVTPIGDE